MIEKSKIKSRIRIRNRINFFLFLIGILSFISAVYSLRQFKLTIIDVKTVFVIHIFFGLLCGALTLEYKRQVHKLNFNFIFHFVWATVVYGFLATGIFYFANDFFANKTEMITWKLEILYKGQTSYKSTVTYVTVEIDNMEKDISLPEINLEHLENMNYIYIKFIKGKFGYKIIKDTNIGDYRYEE